MISYKILLAELLAMDCLTSKEAFHYAMGCVRVEPDKYGRVHLIACNGRCLGLLEAIDATILGDPLPINLKVPVRQLKGLAHPGSFILIEAENGKVDYSTAASSDLPTIRTKEEPDYPNWRQVIPTTPFTPCPLAFDYTLVELFAKAGKVLTGSKVNAYVSIYGHGDKSQAFSVFAGRLYGVVMPCRISSEPEIPHWAKEEPAPEPAAPAPAAPTTEPATETPETISKP